MPRYVNLSVRVIFFKFFNMVPILKDEKIIYDGYRGFLKVCLLCFKLAA